MLSMCVYLCVLVIRGETPFNSYTEIILSMGTPSPMGRWMSSELKVTALEFKDLIIYGDVPAPSLTVTHSRHRGKRD